VAIQGSCFTILNEELARLERIIKARRRKNIKGHAVRFLAVGEIEEPETSFSFCRRLQQLRLL